MTFPSEGIEGRIALIERGEITFDAKVMEVFKAGAIGAIVYNNEPGPFVGALDEESIPAVAISQEDGGTLKTLVEDGPVTATINLVYTEESRNVIADKPGTADDGRVVVLGGHYDTVPSVPGRERQRLRNSDAADNRARDSRPGIPVHRAIHRVRGGRIGTAWQPALRRPALG